VTHRRKDWGGGTSEKTGQRTKGWKVESSRDAGGGGKKIKLLPEEMGGKSIWTRSRQAE